MTITDRCLRATAALAAVPALLAATPAAALDTHFVGARGQAMAGANTASTDGTDAQYYNPAAFGFFGMRDAFGDQLQVDNNNLGRKTAGLGVDAAGGYRLNGNMPAFADRLGGSDLGQFSDGIQTKAEAQDAVQLTNDLAGIDDPGTGFTADATAGAALRLGSFGLGFRGLAQAVGRVDNLDQSNLGLNILGGDIATAYGSTDGTITNLTSAQQSTLTSAGYTGGDLQAIDDAIGDGSIDTSNQDQAIDLLAAAGPSGSSTGPLDQNQTKITFRGFGVAEIPVTYGYAFNEHFSVGGNVKFMRGRVYGNQVLVFKKNNDDVVAKTDEKYEETDQFGVDAGLMFRVAHFQLGVVGRNLNGPTFDGFTDPDTGRTYDDVTIDPQARAGIAFIPFNTLTLEADYDLTENETLLEDYETRFASVGLEWDVLRFLALRAGAYDNQAEDDIGVVYTAGLGLNLWAVRADLAAAMSAETTEVDGEETPSEARASLEVSFDF